MVWGPQNHMCPRPQFCTIRVWLQALLLDRSHGQHFDKSGTWLFHLVLTIILKLLKIVNIYFYMATAENLEVLCCFMLDKLSNTTSLPKWDRLEQLRKGCINILNNFKCNLASQTGFILKWGKSHFGSSPLWLTI